MGPRQHTNELAALVKRWRSSVVERLVTAEEGHGASELIVIKNEMFKPYNGVP